MRYSQTSVEYFDSRGARGQCTQRAIVQAKHHWSIIGLVTKVSYLELLLHKAR
jgi:hypothetical protein